MTLTVPGVGSLGVEPWGEPADSVGAFARSAEAAGLTVTEGLVDEILDWYCARRSCRRKLPPPITASVETFGTLTLPSWREPADVVEQFGLAAARDGHAVTAAALTSLMEFLCARRRCARFDVAAPWLAPPSMPDAGPGPTRI